MRVKICGITSAGDALAAVEAGADAVGLNFVGGPRQIKPARAREILAVLPPMVTAVALVNVDGGAVADELVELLGEFWVAHVQLYGDVTPAAVAQLIDDGFRPIPVIAVRDQGFADEPPGWLVDPASRQPAAVVLDAFDPVRKGGTGKTFRWDWVVAARESGKLDRFPPIILAGGLNPDNVAEAVHVVQPYAVDVASGIEVQGKLGVKDPERMRAFVRNAKADSKGIS